MDGYIYVSLFIFKNNNNNTISKNNKFFSYNVILLHTKNWNNAKTLELVCMLLWLMQFGLKARQYLWRRRRGNVYERIADYIICVKMKYLLLIFIIPCANRYFTVSVHSPKEIDNINEKCSSCQQLNSINTTRDL